jgi:hypothetical protein
MHPILHRCSQLGRGCDDMPQLFVTCCCECRKRETNGADAILGLPAGAGRQLHAHRRRLVDTPQVCRSVATNVLKSETISWSTATSKEGRDAVSLLKRVRSGGSGDSSSSNSAWQQQQEYNSSSNNRSSS